jgi:glucose/arabinose dehydrogenase
MYALRPPTVSRFFLCLTLTAALGAAACRAGSVKDGDVIKTEDAEFRFEVLAKGLSKPWGMVELPDGRLLVTEKKGTIRVIENGQLQEAPLENMLPVWDRGQGGLLDLELHPDYAKNGWIYISFSDPSEDGKKAHTRIIRAKLKGNALENIQDVFKAPADQYQGGGNHFGNRMEFDKDNYLFFTIGERGQQDKAQKLEFVQGKVHRLKDDGAVPEDNPFVKTAGAMPSIWTYGNRNPQGLRFQPGTGVLWETEHGPRGGDELNIIKKGANYGWPVITYGINYNGTPITDKTEAPGMEQPVTYWVPSIACAGLDFYNGDRFPKWKGNAFVAALAHSKLTRVVIEGQKATHQEIMLQGAGRMRDVRCLSDGFVYIVFDDPGQVARLVPVK